MGKVKENRAQATEKEGKNVFTTAFSCDILKVTKAPAKRKDKTYGKADTVRYEGVVL